MEPKDWERVRSEALRENYGAWRDALAARIKSAAPECNLHTTAVLRLALGELAETIEL